MEQPKKEKKKVTVKVVANGNLNGETVDLTPKEMEVKKKAAENAKNKKEVDGLVQNPNGSYSPKPYEKTYVKGKPEAAVKPKVVSQGTKTTVKVPQNRDFTQFRQEFVKDSTNTMYARANKADWMNSKAFGDQNSASARRDAEAAASEKQRFEFEEKKKIEEAKKAAAKRG